MFEKFYKYQSLGNDFIVFDCYQEDFKDVLSKIAEKQFGNFVQHICDRHFGIGADGVLVLINNQDLNISEAFIFNSDGSKAETCLNGLRCICLHLFTKYSLPKNFQIKMHQRIFNSIINNDLTITNQAEVGSYLKEELIKILDRDFSGNIINVGNPHFVVFQKIDLNLLKQIGFLIEIHEKFENDTNVEFLWPDKSVTNKYHMLVHERGCGITLSCGSGVAAIMTTLFNLQKIKTQQKICINMLGGEIISWIDELKKINLKASAYLVFKGHLNKDSSSSNT